MSDSDVRTAGDSLTVAIPADLAATIRAIVADGGYASPNDFVREAVREWAATRASLRQDVLDGLDSGPAIAATEVFAELHARYATVP